MSAQALSRSELTALVLDLRYRVEKLEKGRDFRTEDQWKELQGRLVADSSMEKSDDLTDNLPVSGDELDPILPFQRGE